MLSDKSSNMPQFTWRKLNSELRVKRNSRNFKVPLRPTVSILSKHGCQQNIQKSLQFQQTIGWNWHKSSNLPILSLKLEIRDHQKATLLVPPSKLQARIYSVKIVQNCLQKEQVPYLQDIGIKGQNKIQLSQGCGYFNGLRFASTSYNNEGVKFYLLIVVFSSQDSNQMPENIICSVISPPIFVDSRKSARNYQEKKYMSFVELFNPNQLSKLFTKRDNKQEVDENKQITNNQEGLYNYLTAPNIRHKVKHPLFLSVKFSNSFKILFNSKCKYFSGKQVIVKYFMSTQLSGVIKRFQKKIIKQVGSLRRLKKGSKVLEKQFVIVLGSKAPSSSQVKIYQMLQYLELDSIHLSDGSSFSEECFVDIGKIGDVTQVYKNEYFSLKKKSQNQIYSRRLQWTKKQQDDENFPENQFPDKKTLEGICQIQEQQSEKMESQQAQRENKKSQEKENLSQGPNAFQSIKKRVKVNEDLNIAKCTLLPQGPFREHFQQSFPRRTFRFQKSRYSNFRNHCPLFMEDQTVKEQQQYINVYINKNYIRQKIKQMSDQVFQRNKKHIFNPLQTLKKCNVNIKIKDVENFIYSYSNALLSQIHLRERLLNHMYLENQILKAKAETMQQMATTDLQQIKNNIMSMDKFLPQSFIISKIKENSLWSDKVKVEKNQVKVAQVRMLDQNQEGCQNNLQIIYNKVQLPRVQQVSSNEGCNEQISSACNFVPNVFDIPESPMNR